MYIGNMHQHIKSMLLQITLRARLVGGGAWGGLQATKGSRRVGHNLGAEQHTTAGNAVAIHLWQINVHVGAQT